MTVDALLPHGYRQVFPRESLAPELAERYRVDSLMQMALLRSLDALNDAFDYNSVVLDENKERLAPAERAMIRGLIHRSDMGTRKFEGARQTIGNLPGYINPETVSHPPVVEESFYNRSLPNARWIAALKAYQDLSQIDTEFPPEFRQKWDEENGELAAKLDLSDPFQQRIYDGLRYLWYLEHQSTTTGRQIEWNKVGTHAFVVASDILVKRVPGDDREVEKVHKPKTLTNKEDAFEFLRGTVGETAPLLHGGYLHTEYEAALATYEIFSDSGMTAERHVSIKQRPASDEFLLALIYGVHNPAIEGRISNLTKSYFERVYYVYMRGLEGASPDDLRGYTPESGMPLELLSKINGGWPDDCGFVTDLLIEEITIDGVTVGWEDGDAFNEKVAVFRQLARGNPLHLNALIRRHIQLLHVDEAEEGTARAEETYYAVGQSLTEAYQAQNQSERRLLGGTWYELGEDLNTILGSEYWDVLAQSLLAA